jgi:hypothetical protein
MRRLFLVAPLCVAAVLSVSASSASAAFTGTCKFKGTATFKEPAALAKTPPAPWKLQKYEFKTEPAGAEFGAECETLPGKVKLKGKAEVSGEGKLSCTLSIGGFGNQGKAAGEQLNKFLEELKLETAKKELETLELLPTPGKTGEPGVGNLKISATGAEPWEGGAAGLPFKFRFLGKGTEVNFQTGNEEAGVFVPKAHGEASFAKDLAGASACANPLVEGPSSLKFEAAAAGEIG